MRNATKQPPRFASQLVLTAVMQAARMQQVVATETAPLPAMLANCEYCTETLFNLLGREVGI